MCTVWRKWIERSFSSLAPNTRIQVLARYTDWQESKDRQKKPFFYGM